MRRPLSRWLPPRLRERAYYRYYHRRHARWRPLFSAARLFYAPRVRMFDLVPGDVISGCIAFTGFYERELSERIVRLAQSGGVLVDVGANLGYFSLLWCASHPSARAVAFEASPRNVALFRQNVERNGLEDRITIVAKAASDELGTVRFALGPSDQTGWGGIAARGDAETISVPAVRIDHELAEETIEVLKVDVEGADTLVLYGCEALLRRCRIRTIFFEQNTDRMASLGIAQGAAQAFLRSCRYSCLPINDNASEWIARAETSPP
jgi:FkbM family methyltransferase